MIDPLRMVTGYASSFAAIAITWFIVVWAAPASFWLEYHDVKFVEKNGLNNSLLFQSFRTVKRPVSISGVDILYCDQGLGHGFVYASDKPWKSGFTVADLKIDIVIPKPWEYGGYTPSSGVCYLVSKVNIDLGYGIVKPLPPIVGETFRIRSR